MKQRGQSATMSTSAPYRKPNKCTICPMRRVYIPKLIHKTRIRNYDEFAMANNPTLNIFYFKSKKYNKKIQR